MRTNENQGDSTNTQINLQTHKIGEIITDFIRTDNPNVHLERINDLLIHRLVYTNEHDLTQSAKQDYQFTIMTFKQLVNGIIDVYDSDIKRLNY